MSETLEEMAGRGVPIPGVEHAPDRIWIFMGKIEGLMPQSVQCHCQSLALFDEETLWRHIESEDIKLPEPELVVMHALRWPMPALVGQCPRCERIYWMEVEHGV